MFGFMFAGVFLSYFSDKNGRKPVAVVSIALELVATLSCALSVNFWQYLASRFFLGFGVIGRSLSLQILSKKRKEERLKETERELFPSIDYLLSISLH